MPFGEDPPMSQNARTSTHYTKIEKLLVNKIVEFFYEIVIHRHKISILKKRVTLSSSIMHSTKIYLKNKQQ